MKPYYQAGGVTIYHADCRDLFPLTGAVLVTDPPYGIEYSSGKTGQNGGRALPGIAGDAGVELRDLVLADWGDRPAIVFGSWKRARPAGVVALLTWDKGDHVGMGDLSVPWKPNTEEIYILGSGFTGRRSSSVLRYNAPVSWNSTRHGREHAHEKPVGLMLDLVCKCPPGAIVDPFAGVGSTLVAAKQTGRRAIGVELEERYCEIAARRMQQGVLFGVAGE
jgi:site-specific DNA-methyltransferase (adenine-specific)